MTDADDLEDLSQASADEVGQLSDDQLVSAIQQSEQTRKAGRERTGRLLAELYGRGHLSWPVIARLTGIRQTTAYELAQPYLSPDDGEERGR